ncbi:hypothetical protein DC31_06755 [Microbacterium sp. CH12i]|uniref:TetR/AcrR family transcriptional regulator n=1 Tax=Microbacterium sp. CH12i TaxID=1479651 RepID=UPI00046181B6|nr:TetR/AcrR family transcriptional regulator [Microbacterium sp. CH12i]KDA06905.1 hypothetical protein DC31_06755 [Microbacterium sp. CH12i]
MIESQRVAGPKARRRRESILEAAENLFATKGFSATTTQEIADSVGILKGSLYYYVSSKEELLFEVVLRNHQRLHRHVLDDSGLDTLSELEAVRLFVERHVSFVLTHNAVSALYLLELEVVRTVDAWWEVLAAERRSYEGALVRLIESAHAHGGVVVDDAALTARALLSMANATIRWFRSDGPYRREEVAAHHAALAVRALSPVAGAALDEGAAGHS